MLGAHLDLIFSYGDLFYLFRGQFSIIISTQIGLYSLFSLLAC